VKWRIKLRNNKRVTIIDKSKVSWRGKRLVNSRYLETVLYILLYSELPRYPSKNSHNETNEKGGSAQYSLLGAPLRSNTKNHNKFLSEVEGFLSMLHS